MIQQSTAYFILIDGLDECDAAERRTVLDALSSLAATPSHLRIFITSRDSVSIDLRGESVSWSKAVLWQEGLLRSLLSRNATLLTETHERLAKALVAF